MCVCVCVCVCVCQWEATLTETMATAVSHKGGPDGPTWSRLRSDCCAHRGQSSCRSTLCPMTATFVGRESGVCDTNSPHYNPLVAMAITDGCLHGAGSTKRMQQDLFITYWALRPSAYNPSTSTVHSMCVCVCVCVCVCEDKLARAIKRLPGGRHKRCKDGLK